MENFDDIDLDDYLKDIDFGKGLDDNKVNARENDRICPSCGSEKIMNDYSGGKTICTTCGQVLGSLFDHAAEWKQFDDEERNRGRCGAPTNQLLPQTSLGLMMTGKRNKIKMINNWNLMPYRERSLNTVFRLIHDVCLKMNILKCIEDDAKIMYKAITDCKHDKGKNNGRYVITRGKNRLGIIAACLFFACRRKKMSHPPKKIATMFNINKFIMNRGCKNFLRFLKKKNFDMNMGIIKSDQFVKLFCNNLHVKTHLTEQAIKITRNIEKLNIASEHTPFSIAASSILLMAETNKIQSITKQKLADHFEISDVTIGKAFKKIEKYRDILIDDTKVNDIMEQHKYIPSNKTPYILDRMKKFGINIFEINKRQIAKLIEEIQNDIKKVKQLL
jgi:transcription initiation factor TFIIIB Brf1 subunit/transcription initiation factor TFIIB